MGDPCILLVTGSRALADTVAAMWWARQQILRAIADMPTPPILVHGAATGPDEWAQCIADAANTPTRAYLLDGWVYSGQRMRADRWGERGTTPAREWPLRRNDAMVAWVAAQSGDRRCLALVHPDSKTHGAAYTARRAREAGIATTVHVCPRELGPEVRDG